MLTYYFERGANIKRFLASMLIVMLVASALPVAVFADEIDLPTDTQSAEESSTATSTDTGITGTTTSANNGSAGTDGTQTDDAATTTTATSTDTGGADGASGTEGETGSDGGNTTVPTGDTVASLDEGEPVEVTSDSLINDPDAPEEVEATGNIVDYTGNSTLIETGRATARVELFTDANSNDVRSELTAEAARGDLDIYTFNATGSNRANVNNDGAIFASTGNNDLSSRIANVVTGDAISAFNIANIINTNVINSDGLIYLGNQILEAGESLDLTHSFFPDPEKPFNTAGVCSLLSCAAEDITYNISQTNTATVTNQALVEASTGANIADGNLSATVTTGNAYATANVMNVVNTNIIDSNYQLLTFNAIGDLEGDLILPTEELFKAYFAQPNGLNQLEDREDSTIAITNSNAAVINNDLDTYGQTGNNDSSTDFSSTITTGQSETESNILNKVNENVYGADSFFILVRVHGAWNGDVHGLPEGLTWDWTPDGVVIYNEDTEISPSQMLGYDVDSYSVYINNQNDALSIDNSLTLTAVTGENEIDGLTGSISTGDAYASANVMNIANTNIIGTNWTFAVINIMGDFDGNISFTSTDLALTGSVSSAKNPAGPGDTLTYVYTITNNSTKAVTNVTLDQTLQNAKTSTGQIGQSANVGSIPAGGSKVVTLNAKVNPTLPYGTSTITAFAKVTSTVGDSDFSNNIIEISNTVFHLNPVTTNNPGSGATTSTTTQETGGGGVVIPPPSPGGEIITPPSSSGGGGGGGGSSTYKKKDVKREQKAVDPSKAPQLLIKKIADVKEGSTINAGDSVDYKITVTNAGGTAYDTVVFDTLRNPLGKEVNSQSWDLGTILPGEEIRLTYTTEYDLHTPSGIYTNTASIEAYLKKDTKELGGEPLKIDDAVYRLDIDGVDLAVGDVATIAFFPTGVGKIAALLTWQTSTSSLSRVYYGPYQTISQYDASKPNLGYQSASVMFPQKKTTHYMIILGLQPGTSYGYRIHSQDGTNTIVSREYTFVVPNAVTKLSLAIPTTPFPTPQVAGASTIPPVYQAPTPVYSAPAPVISTEQPAAPKSVVVEEPEPTPPPKVEPEPAQSSDGGFFNKVTNFFRW